MYMYVSVDHRNIINQFDVIIVIDQRRLDTALISHDICLFFPHSSHYKLMSACKTDL